MAKEKSADKTVGGILQSLMTSPRFARDEKKEKARGKSELTSLGVLLMRQDDGHYFINMAGVRVFSGIAEFVQLLASNLLQQSFTVQGDVMVQQLVDAKLTPELAELGVVHVSVFIRSRVARNLSAWQETFRRQILLAFDAIQSARWGGLLFPNYFNLDGMESPSSSGLPALIFPFQLAPQREGEGYFLLLEYDPEGRFLRITVERIEDSRLHLKRIPHRVVEDAAHRHPLHDLAQTAEQIYQGIHRECQNQQDEYIEIPGRQPVLFERLIGGGMKDVALIKVRWPLEDSSSLLFDRDRSSIALLSKTLLLFEDPRIIAVLAAGSLLEMSTGSHRVFLDLSRGGSCLNVSLYERREVATMDEHLARMPALKSLVRGTSTPMENIRVLLIHHSTSEVLGLIQALDRLHCAFVQTLFIKYKGIVPDKYLEALFTLPEDRFRYHALQRVEVRDTVEGCYFLSDQYSPLDDLESVQRLLLKGGLDYFEAMKITAGHLFFGEVLKAKEMGQRLLLVEDGGYLAPLVNQFCLENKTLREALNCFAIDASDSPERFKAEDLDSPLSAWLDGVFPGSIEHTRNGHDQLHHLQAEHGRLAFPALSIAISHLKNIEEARECASALLAAVESIFHGMGKLFSRRHVLVIGCRGNIGRNLVKDLSRRIVHGSLCGIDISLDGGSARPYIGRKTVYELPEEALLDLDLIVGTAGRSVLKEDILEKIVLEGRSDSVFFASGSTKTVEFAELSRWLQKLLDDPHPRIRGIPVTIRMTPVKDPQTGLIQGNRARIRFDRPSASSRASGANVCKDLYLLGDLMPINFLYYGVPTEIIDEVLCQLLLVLIGFVESIRTNAPLPARLLSVDHEIDVHAKPIG